MKFISFFVLALLFQTSVVLASGVTGTVRDEQGEPLGFATILVKGSPYGATANAEGKYSIRLAPGRYTLECRYVGYATEEKEVLVTNAEQEVDFVLKVQDLKLAEIVIDPNSEDPAYEIIRNAIKQRAYYEGQVSAFSADVYIKGIIRLLQLPDKVFGRKVETDDMEAFGIDSSGQGIIYLSESLTRVFEQKPDKLKMQVISNQVSGSDGFGLDFPAFISFYKNLVDVSRGTLSKRGFVSPIADNALRFYKYKFLGSFWENGKQVNSIQVIPRRDYEPVFSGIINITENDWRIFSCKLLLTQTSQLQVLDSLEITQIHAHQYKDIWRVKSQVIHFHINQLGVAAEGDFVNVYNHYDLNPKFEKGFFDRVIIRYDTASNKRPDTYWDSIRPVPLEPDEIRDYRIKDSLKILRDSVIYNRDSLRKLQKFPGLMDILLFDATRNYYGKKRPTTFKLEGLLKGLQYNTVDGVSINPSLVVSKFIPSLNATGSVIADVRYGFNNSHLNPWAGFVLTDRLNTRDKHKFRNYEYYVAGGKRVSQFFKMSSLTGLGNSISTLLYGWNEMKLYENYFFKTGFKKAWDNGVNFKIEGVYEDRIPLENTTFHIWNKKWESRLTPNYPTQIMNAPFQPHKAVVLHGSFSFQPGQRYIQYPDVRYSLGSKYPVFTFNYYKGVPGLFKSDTDFDRWQVDVEGDVRLRLSGRVLYNVITGGFLNNKKVFVQDYKHYYGTHSHIADEYTKAFQYTMAYQYSNASPYFAEVHVEHHAYGWITNKIPLLKKWNWNLVDGFNGLFISPERHHLELFVGLENILKLYRFDVLLNLENGNRPVWTYRIGFGGLIGDVINKQRFARHDKIINPW